jgi:TRAP transporter TAXI family solute receptor
MVNTFSANKLVKYILLLFCAVSFLVIFNNSYAQNNASINVGTGNKNALAYPIMSSICETFNKYSINKEARCSAVSTGGSEDNLEGIFLGKYDAGVIKADMGYNAYNGIGVFSGKPYRKLRAIFGLHNEYLTIIVKKNSNIKSLQDFRNKRVYLGNKGSGSRLLVDRLFSEIGWKSVDFREIHEAPADQIYNLFCENKIDAAIYLVGHPNSIFMKTLSECNTQMISFSRKEIESYIDVFRHIYPATIRKGTYKEQKLDINTFASQLLLTASEDLDEEIVYNFVQVISDHYKEIQNQNPTLKGTSLFSSEVNALPLHKGSARFYKNMNFTN